MTMVQQQIAFDSGAPAEAVDLLTRLINRLDRDSQLPKRQEPVEWRVAAKRVKVTEVELKAQLELLCVRTHGAAVGMATLRVALRHAQVGEPDGSLVTVAGVDQ